MFFNRNDSNCKEVNEDAFVYVWYPLLMCVCVNVFIAVYAYSRRRLLTNMDRIGMIAATILVYLAVKHNFRGGMEKFGYSDPDCEATHVLIGSPVIMSVALHFIIIPCNHY